MEVVGQEVEAAAARLGPIESEKLNVNAPKLVCQWRSWTRLGEHPEEPEVMHRYRSSAGGIAESGLSEELAASQWQEEEGVEGVEGHDDPSR